MDTQEVIEDAESILEINQNELDREWVRQPWLYFRHAQEFADARQRLDEEKANLSIIRAEASLEIRTKPEAFNVTKLTEGVVKETLETVIEVQDAEKAVREAKHAVDIYQGLVTALDHKKRALESLVHLHGQSYFASPQASGDDRDAMEEVVSKAAHDRVRPKRKRGK